MNFLGVGFATVLLASGCCSGQAQTGQASSTDRGGALDLLDTARGLNSFAGSDFVPWHLRASYTFLNADGQHKGNGTLEIFWAGPAKFKQTFSSKEFTQTDYQTDAGLVRTGTMDWAAIADQRVIDNLLFRIPARDALEKLDLDVSDRTMAGVALHCIALQPRGTAHVSTPPTFCFSPGSPLLRYTSGLGRNVIEQQSATLFNSLVLFRGHEISRDRIVAYDSRPCLQIHIDTLEDLAAKSDELFKPPANAAVPPPQRQYVDQLHMQSRIVKRGGAAWGRGNSSEANVKGLLDVIVGKDGVVKIVRPITGPAIYESAEIDAVKKQTYQPTTVNGQAVEVETEISYVFK